jgi:Fur family zinc uptake transcriptional regulator
MPLTSAIAFRKHDHRRCERQLLSEARQLCKARKLRLTSRRRQVLEILLASHQPLGAYGILAELNRPANVERIAPPIVYRALEFLMAEGLIHRIESRNAFISCIHPGHRSAAQFLICRDCEQVAELESIDSGLLSAADNLGFAVDHSVVGKTADTRSHQLRIAPRPDHDDYRT